MFKLLKLLGIFAILTCSIGNASALSVSTSPIFATGTVEDFIFSYSGGPFTLSSLSFASPPAGNLLTTLTPYTTALGGTLSGSGSISEIISTAPGTAYTASYTIAGTLPSTITVTLSAVPLPASFPMFALALICLGALGYHAARREKRDTAKLVASTV